MKWLSHYLPAAILLTIVVYSCRKEHDLNTNGLMLNSTAIEVQQWLAKQKADTTLSANANSLLLQADWETAHTIVTDSINYKIVLLKGVYNFVDSNKVQQRYLVLQSKVGSLIVANIYELFGAKKVVQTKTDDIIINFGKKVITNFSGDIVIYSWNYKINRSNIYVNGLNTNYSLLQSKSKKKVIQSTKTSEDTTCIDWYWCTYGGDGLLISEVYLYTTCNGPTCQPVSFRSPNGQLNVKVSCAVGGESGDQDNYTIIIDSLQKHYPCAVKLIINRLNLFPDFYVFTKPFQTVNRPDLSWSNGSLPWNVQNGGSNSFQTGNTESLGYTSTVILNDSLLTNSSQLLIAGTAIHESIHAYINFNIKTAGYDVTDNLVTTGTWLYGIDAWYTVAGMPSNFSNHYAMLDNYFNQAVSLLGEWDNHQHTTKEYAMIMSMGLDNPGATTTPTMTNTLNNEYNSILNRYGISKHDLDVFLPTQLNSVNNKLPGLCN